MPPRAGVTLPIDRLSPYVRICARVDAMAHGLATRVITDHELLFFRRGRGRFRIAGEDHEIAPATLFLIPPGVAHGFSAPTAGEPYAFLSLHLDPWFEPGRERVGYLGSRATPRGRWVTAGARAATLPHRLVLREPRLYERLFASVHAMYPLRDLVLTGAPLPDAGADRLRLAGAALELVAFVVAEADAPAGRLSPRQREGVERAAALLAATPGPLAVTALARRVGLGRARLARCFAIRYGAPPSRWHLRQRIARAQDHLVRDRLPIKAVAERLGFASVHQFTRCFARVCGLPPAAWRALRERGPAELMPPV